MSDLLTRYATHGHDHDEMLRTSGDVRRLWRDLVGGAGNDLGRLVEATATAAELRRGYVATATDRTSWRPDPLPLLLTESDWAPLEAAAQQRMELLDAILTDLYGDRRLLSSGLLPPEVVVAHPGFLRAADRIALPGDRQLVLAAVDVARNADGAWVVLDDRCDAPAGLGAVVENRQLMAQVLGDHYRRAHVRRVGPFFHALSAQLQQVAPASAGPTPTVALLAPAHDAATRQDDAAVASQLGIRLVHAEDLVVRDSQVWTASLGTPERVDVLLRRVQGSDCDPLELRAAGGGTPGLVHAARSGRLSIANPVGSGVLGTPALLPYLPRIARAVLGADLALHSAVTYWCGDRSMCSHVIANLGRLVLKPARAGRQAAAIRGWELSIDEQAELAAQIAARPGAWVGQEPIQVSTTPTVAAGRLVAAPTGLRLFATGTADGYRLLPGGVGRVMRDEFGTGPSPAPGTVKDVWVMASGPPTSPPGPTGRELRRRPDPAGVAPRVARDLFRLGFHTERAEGTVRLLRAVTAVDQDDDALRALLPATEDGLGGPVGLVVDPGTPGSVASDVDLLARAAAGAREQVSGDTWLAVASLRRTLAGLGTTADAEDVRRCLPRLLESLLAMSAVVTEGTVHDLGWTLTMTGRRLARAQRITQTLTAGVTHRPDAEAARVVDTTILAAHESSITHRRRYHDAGALAGMLDLLLWEPANPRSLRFQLAELTRLLGDVPVTDRGPETRDQLLRDIDDLLTELATRDVLDHPDAAGGYPPLAESLRAISWRLTELHREIDQVLVAPTAAHFGMGQHR